MYVLFNIFDGRTDAASQPFVTSTRIKTIMLQIHISYKTSDAMSSLESHNASCLHF